MRAVRSLMLAFFCCMLLSCLSLERLVGNDPATAYFLKAYSVKNPITRLLVLNESQYDYFLNMFKESIVKDSSLTAVQQDEQYKALSSIKYADNQYIAYLILLNTPVPLHMQDFTLIFDDDSGSTAIDSVLYQSAKVTYQATVNYDYIWFIKLKAPFQPPNYSKHSYVFSVTYPNFAAGTYELFPRVPQGASSNHLRTGMDKVPPGW